MKQSLLILCILSIVCLIGVQPQDLYRTSVTTMKNQTWMGSLDYGIPLRQLSMLGTHNSVAFKFCLFETGGFQQTQISPLNIQLESGIRAIDIRVKHDNDKFQVYDRACNLDYNFDQILTIVKTFLTTYPSETVLLHLVEERTPSGCTRSFQDTFKAYRDAYPLLFWTPTTQDPQLGQVRGQIVLLQQFSALQIHGLLWTTFNVLPNYKMGTIGNLYDRWLQIKNFLPNANTARKSQIQFWSGHGGAYPYFVVSGKSSRTGPRLLTGMTTPGWKNSVPDFPRIDCFIGICSIAYEGMNILAYNRILSQGYTYTGIIYTDFYGDDLLKMVVGKNVGNFPKCTALQVTQGCTLCQAGTGACLKCNVNIGYLYDSVNKICVAKVGYYLDANYYPQLCSSAMIGCLECSSVSVCTKCDAIAHYLLSSGSCIAAPGYYLDASSIPTPCPQQGCAQCADAVSCTLCSAPNNYIMDTGTGNTCICDSVNFFQSAVAVQSCICMATYYLSPANTCLSMPKCPDQTGGCLDCTGSALNDICIDCDQANNFIFDPTNVYCVCKPKFFFDGTACASCTVNDAACSTCANQNLCLSCVANFTLVNAKCQCIAHYYQVDPDTCQRCTTGCLTCTGVGACSLCDSANNFVLVNGYCECKVGMFESGGVCYVCGAMAGCLDCNTGGCIACDPVFGFHLDGTQCACDYGFFINDMKICEKCSQQGCLNCLTQDHCLQCDTSLYYLAPNNTCDDICGDGSKIYTQCDDGNTLNGDGCSSLCTIQNDYTCIGGSLTQKDTCSYSGPFYLTVVRTFKHEKQNKLFVDLMIKPNIQSLKGIDFSVAITPTFPFKEKKATFEPDTGAINFQFQYSTSLNALTSVQLGVTFDPPVSQPEYFYMKAASFLLPEVTENNLALKYYDDQIYSLLDLMRTLTEVTAFLYVGICFFCFIFLSKLIAIELILVPQIAFAGLIMIERIQSLLQPLANLRITNGYNPLFKDTVNLPPRLSILFYEGEFLSNFNICLVVIILPILVGLIMLLIGKIMKSQKIMRFSYRSMKQWSLSVLLIFQFQFTISFGIDFIYGNTIVGKAIGGLLFVGLLVLLVLLFKRPLNFGDFKSYFKKQPRYLNTYIVVVIFRVLLALDLIFLSSNKMCGFVALGVCGVYTLFLLILRPYENNVRPIINMIFTIAFLAVESVYKMNFYSADAQFITTYLPLFMQVGLLLLLLINVIFMVVEACSRFKKNKLNQSQKNLDESFDQELKKELNRQLQVINTIRMALTPSNINKMKEKEKYNDNDGDDSSRILAYSSIKQLHKQLKKPFMLQAKQIEFTAEEEKIYEQI